MATCSSPAVALALALLAAGPACGRVLEVGDGKPYRLPSEAAAAAQDGDTVSIAAGDYFDCAIWAASDLTIAGPAAPAEATITDRACEGKAAFVLRGHDVTIRDLGFARIRVPDGNGAGIRAEGRDLTVVGARFVDTQVAILNAANGGALRIQDSRFEATGANVDLPAVIGGALDLLRVQGARYSAPRGGRFLSASAVRGELVGCALDDARGRTRGPLASLAAAIVLIEGNEVTLDAGALDAGAGRPGAILLTGDGAVLTVRDNRMLAGAAPLVRNWSGATPEEAGNQMPPGVPAVSDDGATYHRARARAAAARDWAIDLARQTRHRVAVAARWIGLR